MKVLTLGTNAHFYAGLSLVWEHPAVDSGLTRFISLLVEAEALDLASHYASESEFRLSRQEAYAHDQVRYPAYFVDGKERGFKPTIFKAEGATAALESGLRSVIGSGISAGGAAARVITDVGLEVAKTALARREREAITFRFFASGFRAEQLLGPDAGGIRRAISALYAEHNLKFVDGNLATGVRGLDLYDHLFPRGFPRNDVRLLARLLGNIGLGELIERPTSELSDVWQAIVWERAMGGDLAASIGRLIDLAVAMENGQDSPDTQRYRPVVWARIQSWLRLTEGVSAEETIEGRLVAAAARLNRLLALLRKRPDTGEELRRAESEENRQVDWLLVTATDTEDDALRTECWRRFGRRGSIEVVRGMTFTDYGRIGGGTVWHVRSEMGSVGPGGSTLTVFEALFILDPRHVVMPGIAFGVNEGKQSVGTVLVSESLVNYNIGRASTSSAGELNFESRSYRARADPKLISRFRALRGSRRHEIDVGLMVSGEALVDNVCFRDQVLGLAPGAIGGEMEGSGLYSAAERRHVPWILAKAVCDWADGKKGTDKESRQRLAAASSVATVVDALELGNAAL